MDLLEELVRVTKELEKHKVEYAVCGGIAVLVHGIVRNTIDIDILIHEEALEAAKSASAAAGFDFESGWIPIPGDKAPRVFRLLKIKERDYVMLDLMIVDESLEDFWKDRFRCPFGDKQINVISKSSLIKMKSQSKRLKDQMDVESLNALGEE